MRRPLKKPQRSSRKWSKGKPTILVIEDERFVGDVTCEVLRDAGYRVLHAECAAAARAIFLSGGKQIQLLLCDAILPDGSGIALSQMLRAHSPGLKIVLASGYPAVGRNELHGVDRVRGFLVKPYGAAALIARVQAALQAA